MADQAVDTVSPLRDEVRRQLGLWYVLLAAGVMFALGVLSVAWEQAQMGGFRDTHQNSPYAIADRVLIASILLAAVTAPLAHAAFRRASDAGLAGAGHLGRFLAAPASALITATLVLAALPLGIWLGTLVPGVDPARIGPNRPEAYLFAMVVLGLPNLALVAACSTCLATFLPARRMVLPGLALAGLWLGTIALKPLGWPGALLEPFAATAYFGATAHWTFVERNAIIVGPFGVLFANRLLWLGVTAALLVVAFRRHGRTGDAAARPAPGGNARARG